MFVRLLFMVPCLLLSFQKYECKNINSLTGKFSSILLPNKPKCTEKTLLNAEAKMVRLLAFGPKGRPYPSSIEQMKQFCNETSQLSTQIENYSRSCIKPEVHNLNAVFLYSIRNTFTRNYCGKKNLKKNLVYIKDAACINRHYFNNYHCFATFNNQTRGLVNLKKDSLKIPHTCCNFVKLMDCLGKLMDSHSCLAKHRDDFLGVIRQTTAGLTDLTCGEINEDTDRCDHLEPSPSAPNPKQYNSFILALVDLVASMKGFNVPNL